MGFACCELKSSKLALFRLGGLATKNLLLLIQDFHFNFYLNWSFLALLCDQTSELAVFGRIALLEEALSARTLLNCDKIAFVRKE